MELPMLQQKDMQQGDIFILEHSKAFVPDKQRLAEKEGQAASGMNTSMKGWYIKWRADLSK